MNVDALCRVRVGRIMVELAWLSYLRGEWLLVTTGGEGTMRRWTDQDLALRDLEHEGWTVSRPVRGRPSERAGARGRRLGYCLKRTIH